MTHIYLFKVGFYLVLREAFSQDSSLKTEYYNNLFSLIILAIFYEIAKGYKISY